MSAQTEIPQDGRTHLTREGTLAILTLSYPERRNALALGLRAEMTRHLVEVMADPEIRAVILTGEGAHFCSGGDIAGMEGITAPGGRARLARLHQLIRLMMTGEKPIIAAVEGHAAGGGLAIACACDFIVAAEDAQLSCTFNRIGLMPDMAALWSIPARIGLGRARRLMMLGQRLDGVEAERIGLVDQVTAPGGALAGARAMAAQLAEAAPLANSMIKAALAQMPLALDQLLRLEGDGQGVLFGSEDFAEGRRAFLEKRRPHFQGR